LSYASASSIKVRGVAQNLIAVSEHGGGGDGLAVANQLIAVIGPGHVSAKSMSKTSKKNVRKSKQQVPNERENESR
jgi:hypothetical protein